MIIKKTLIVSIILMLPLINGFIDYTTYDPVRCKVIDKFQTNGGYKRSGRFYLVVTHEDGRVFDIIVSPATYSTSSVGDYKTLEIREMDVAQTPTKNLLYFFAPCVLFSIILVAGVNAFHVLISRPDFK